MGGAIDLRSNISPVLLKHLLIDSSTSQVRVAQKEAALLDAPAGQDGRIKQVRSRDLQINRSADDRLVLCMSW